MKPKRSPHWKVYRDGIGEWRWRFIAANGEIMADSGEGYDSKKKALGARRRFLALIRVADLDAA